MGAGQLRRRRIDLERLLHEECDMNEQKLLTTNLPGADPLTPMQRIFVAEYLRTWNATKAARAAGYMLCQSLSG